MLIRHRPTSVIDWEATAGAGSAAVRAAYPQARLLRVETAPVQTATRPCTRQASAEDATGGAPASPAQPWWRTWLARRTPVGRAWPTPSGEPVQVPLAPHEVPAGEAGLLWANMVLHAHPDPLALMRTWRELIAVDGFLMFSTFGPGCLPEIRQLYAERGWGPPLAPIVDMHDLGDMLVEAGFANPVMDQEQVVLTWARPEAALEELRTLGCNAHPSRFPGCRGRGWHASLRRALADIARRRGDGRVALSFEIAYGHAFRPPPRPALAAQTSLSLQDMRMLLGRRGGPARTE